MWPPMAASLLPRGRDFMQKQCSTKKLKKKPRAAAAVITKRANYDVVKKNIPTLLCNFLAEMKP